ncbi:hypothetical protein NB697_003685 [Xanthomonas sacchari]|nr:hypothetical protein [Xanthomonas sacchari]
MLLIQHQRLALVAGGGVQPRQRGHRLRILVLLRQQRRQRVVGGFEVAEFAQGIDLAQHVAAAQRLVAALLLGAHLAVAQLAQGRRQFRVLVRAQQHAGVLQARLGGGVLRDQALRQGQRALVAADVGVGAGHRRQQCRLFQRVAQRGLGAAQQQLRFATAALLLQQARRGRLLFDPGGVAQRAHLGGAGIGRNAFQAGVGAGPVAAFLRQQRIGVQRLGHVAVHCEQAVHDAARLVRTPGLLVQARQVQPHPRIARVVDHRLLQLALRGDGVAGLQRLLRAGALQVGFQRGLAAGLLALRRAEPGEQRIGLVGAALAAVQGDQALQRAGIVGMQAQRLAVALFGGGGIAGRLQVAQQRVAGGLLGLELDRLLDQAQRGVGVAAGARGLRLLQLQPVARAVQRAAPLAVGGRGRAQQFLRFAEALLAQPHRAQATERLGIARTRAQYLREALFGQRQVAGVERLEAFAQLFAGRIAALRAALLQLRGLLGDLGIVRIGGQERLVQRRIGGAGIEPQQRLAPAGTRRTGDIGALAQRGELGDALAPRRFPVGLHLRQRQRRGGVVRLRGSQAAQAVACAVPALRGAGQRLVVLQRQRVRRALAVEQRLIGAHRVHVAAGGGGAACVAQVDVIAGAADRHGQALGLRRLRMRLLQLRQALARVGLAALRQIDLGQAEQGVGLVRVDPQQLAPGIGGEIVAALVVPVVALADQLLGGVGVLRVRAAGEQAQVDHAGQVQGFEVHAEHWVLQAGCSAPSAEKR